MGDIRKITPVKAFVGMIAKREEDFQPALDIIMEEYGYIDLLSDTIPFTYTDYYKPEMGEGLLRKFASFEELIDPGLLPKMKIFTNWIEETAGNYDEDQLYRRINLDPGYVTLAKMVLATTKNQMHRIYLQQGIYAEITLKWSNKSFRPQEWTYPDYQTEAYINFFNQLRIRYHTQLKELGIRY